MPGWGESVAVTVDGLDHLDAAVLDAVGREEAPFVGNSMGGHTSLRLARRIVQHAITRWASAFQAVAALDSATRSSAMSTMRSSCPPTSPRRPTSNRIVRASNPYRRAAASAWRRNEEYTPA
ncbi:pimeloyl-ACP methyl ester carboxylesterase [Nocardia sp. GAS34]